MLLIHFCEQIYDLSRQSLKNGLSFVCLVSLRKLIYLQSLYQLAPLRKEFLNLARYASCWIVKEMMISTPLVEFISSQDLIAQKQRAQNCSSQASLKYFQGWFLAIVNLSYPYLIQPFSFSWRHLASVNFIMN